MRDGVDAAQVLVARRRADAHSLEGCLGGSVDGRRHVGPAHARGREDAELQAEGRFCPLADGEVGPQGLDEPAHGLPAARRRRRQANARQADGRSATARDPPWSRHRLPCASSSGSDRRRILQAASQQDEEAGLLEAGQAEAASPSSRMMVAACRLGGHGPVDVAAVLPSEEEVEQGQGLAGTIADPSRQLQLLLVDERGPAGRRRPSRPDRRPHRARGRAARVAASAPGKRHGPSREGRGPPRGARSGASSATGCPRGRSAVSTSPPSMAEIVADRRLASSAASRSTQQACAAPGR